MNFENVKNIIKEKFNFIVKNIEIIGERYDSKAYFVNDEYIFKIKISSNKKKGYEKEKAILDFLNKNLNTALKIPNIEFYYVSEENCSRILSNRKHCIWYKK